jgi:hypothetical protein
MIATQEQTVESGRGAKIPAPAPGIYEAVPFDVYLTWDAVSNSSLNGIEKSPLHYKFAPPVEETPPMRFGTFCHQGRLEPSAVFRNYVVMPDLTKGILTKSGEPAKTPKATDEYKQRVERWEADNADGKIIVLQEEFEAMTGVVAALDRNELAHKWFAADGPAEVSIVWDDPDTGVRCKGRLDKLALIIQMIADLKTTRDCLWFSKQIADRKYYRQSAMYIDGVMVLTGEVCRFGIVAVENVQPFGVMAAPLAESAVELGREEYKAALRQIAAARQSNVWPGYENPAEWILPAWKEAQLSEPLSLIIAGERVAL